MDTLCFGVSLMHFPMEVAGEGLVREVWPGDRVPQHRSSPQEQLMNESNGKAASREHFIRLTGLPN